MNLIEKLGLEKCKAIVGGARYPVIGYCLAGNNWIHKQCESAPTGYSNEDNSWSEDYAIDFVSIENLRTAIAKFECDHDWEDIKCNGDLERQLICTYCSMRKSVPFELNAKQWTDEDTDHCTDIRITLAL